MADLYATYGVKPGEDTGPDLYKQHGVEPPSPVRTAVDQTIAATGADQATAGDVARWAGTRAEKAGSGVLSTGRSMADMTQELTAKVAGAFGMKPELAWKVVQGVLASNPITAVGQFQPTAEQLRGAVNKATGFKEQNAPESWGTAGKMLDAGTEAALGSLVTPAGSGMNVVRGLAPAFAGGASSELAGEQFKGTWLEAPARFVAGLLGGTVGAGAQNVATSSAKGVANIVGSNARDAETQAARILGRARLADQPIVPGEPAPPTMAETHAQFLPGTPLAATFPQGGNQMGAVRGAATLTGPARNIVNQGAEAFREGADARIDPVLNRISPLPPAEVRVPQLMDQARNDAGPIYRQAGVADLPQQILQQQPGAPITTRVPAIGPAPFVEKQTPGPPVTTGVATNSPVLQSPALRDFMDQSGIVRQAINRTQQLSAFKNEPLTSMAMLDKVYKDLGSLESTATDAKDFGRARDIRLERQQLAAHIDAENPVYGRALQAYADPASLADAAKLGKTLATQNIPPEEVARQFNALDSDAHRQEFLGGFAGVLRGKAGTTDRATPAERFWNSDYTRGKVQALFPTVTEAGPDPVYGQINQALQNERQAARTLRDITKGSTTANKAVEASDLAGGDAAGVLSDVMHHGVRGAMIAKALDTMGAISGRATEGRTQAVNAALARMAMQTNPADVVRTQGLVETARRQAAATQAARTNAYGSGAVGGLLGSSTAQQQPGPADRLMQNLTGGLLGTP